MVREQPRKLTPEELLDYTVRGWSQLRPEYKDLAIRIFGFSPNDISLLGGKIPDAPKKVGYQPTPSSTTFPQWDYPGLTDQPTRGDLDAARRKLGSFDGRLMQWGGFELGPTEGQISRQTWTEKGDREQALMRKYQDDLERFWNDYYGQQIDQGNAWEQSRANIMAGASKEDQNWAKYGSIRGQQQGWDNTPIAAPQDLGGGYWRSDPYGAGNAYQPKEMIFDW